MSAPPDSCRRQSTSRTRPGNQRRKNFLELLTYVSILITYLQPRDARPSDYNPGQAKLPSSLYITGVCALRESLSLVSNKAGIIVQKSYVHVL